MCVCVLVKDHLEQVNVRKVFTSVETSSRSKSDGGS